MISVHDAERTLAAHQIELPTEEVALDDAVGRVLRQQVAADRDLPPYDRVAMDGIARIDRRDLVSEFWLLLIYKRPHTMV